VNILRFLRPECVAMQLATQPSDAVDGETQEQRARRLAHEKEAVMAELCELLDRSGDILNRSKLYRDMEYRETQASTAIAPGLAIPHVRSMQARRFVIGFARSPEGIWFDSLDGQPTRLFLVLAAPPWDDKLFHLVFRDFAEMAQQEWVAEALMEAQDVQGVINVLRGYISR
jgi:mannitol/fructose-specific phosphotransferase system IIA component (Ntr-type)